MRDEAGASTAKLTDYELHLRLMSQPADTAQDLPERITQALVDTGLAREAIAVSPAQEIVAAPADIPRQAPDVQITPLSTLYLALPLPFQRPDILDELADRYCHERSCLWRTVHHPGCRAGAIRLFPWRRSGTQWICEFMSYDTSVPQKGQYNFHWQETSQWQNPETGWHGHQGAIVFDEQDGRISAHH